LRFKRYRGFSQWDSNVAIEYAEESHPLRSLKFLFNFFRTTVGSSIGQKDSFGGLPRCYRIPGRISPSPLYSSLFILNDFLFCE